MIKKASFKLRPSNQHLELVNSRVADWTDVFAIGPGQAYNTLYGKYGSINHDI